MAKVFYSILTCLVVLAATASGETLWSRPYDIPQPQDSVWDAPDSPDPQVRENDAGRWVLPLRELMERTYDVSGQKAEWVLGTSILGNSELDPFAFGMGSLSRRLPSKLAGIYTTRLGYDGSTLSLNGENGILTELRHGTPVDTPITDLAWERGPFEGNALRLDFRRIITDSVALDFGIQSRSNKNSKEYEYQNVTHSPYFSMGRDSSSIPFAGRNIAMNSIHVQPMLTWRFGFGKAFVKMNYMDLYNADNSTHAVILDSLDKAKRTFQTDPYGISIESRGYGGGLELYPFKKLILSASIYSGTHEIEEDSLPHLYRGDTTWTDTLDIEHTDTLFYDTLREYTYETMLGDFGIRVNTLFNPALKFEYEFLDGYEYFEEYRKQYLQDREIGYLELSDTLGILLFRTQTGLQRNSSIMDEETYAKAYSADATLLLPFHFRVNGTVRRDNKFPDINQLAFTDVGRVSFPNPDLHYEKRNRRTFNIGWYSREVFYGFGIRQEKGKSLLKQRWITGDTSSVEEAFQWINIKRASTLDWMFQTGLRLGNWNFYLERGQVLKRKYELIDTPELYYKGSIHWQNRFVKDRLGVSVRVDWQWFDHRYDCTINQYGDPAIALLKHYLALDFEARMQILSFELYNRIENFNHSIYMPESGYTPEGLRFAYGIVWTFSN